MLHHEVEGRVDELVDEVEGLENQQAEVVERTGDQDGQGGDQGNRANGGIDETPDFFIVTAQQLQDLIPIIIVQV
ncbi:hypothetical protein Tco_0301959, partial [Tanacetum coccineum]